MTDQRNLILAIVLSVAILLGFQIFIVSPQQEQMLEQQQAESELTAPQAETGEAPVAGGTPLVASEATSAMDREDALAQSPRIAIETDTLSGSIALVGARIDDLTLTNYRETIDPDSPQIVLFSPPGADATYFTSFRWSSSDPDLELPRGDTLWQADRTGLTVGSPVTLDWTNSQGVRFEQVIEVDENYMFSITQRVVNGSGATVAVSPYGLISRTGHPDILGFYILHEGLIGVLDGVLEEVDYDDLEDEKVIKNETTGGWIGITDKYWQAVLIPDQGEKVDTRFVYTERGNKYQTDFLYDGVAVPAGKSFEVTSRLFAGAKVVQLLDGYREDLDIVNFDKAVDFGWFYPLTKPFFYMLKYFGDMLGNFGLSILLVTVIIKLVFFPLANKSYRSMAKMRKLQPEMEILKKRFGDDRQRMNQEVMALYKKEGANPMSGCLPMVIQIPVFFALYKVLFVTIEMRHAPFYGWIRDLSAPDPTSVLNIFGLLPFGIPDLGLLNVLSIGVFPIAMGLTMLLQHRLNPQPPDPVQAKVFMMMPIVFTFLLARFPAGLVIYWTWNNLLSIIQQMVIMKRAGVPIGRARGTQSTVPAPSTVGPGNKPARDKSARDKPARDEPARDEPGAEKEANAERTPDGNQQRPQTSRTFQTAKKRARRRKRHRKKA